MEPITNPPTSTTEILLFFGCPFTDVCLETTLGDRLEIHPFGATGETGEALSHQRHEREVALNNCINIRYSKKKKKNTGKQSSPRSSNFIKYVCPDVHPRAQRDLLLSERSTQHNLSEPILMNSPHTGNQNDLF